MAGQRTNGRSVQPEESERDYPRDYLTTAQTAQRLGIKPDTVYAYVSRGLLTSVRLAGERGSRFAADEVEALANRVGGHRAPTGSIERIHTRLTWLSDDRFYYRGTDAVELATTRSLESVAHLLWRGELTDPGPFRAPADLTALVRYAVRPLPDTARLTDRIRMTVAALGAADPLRFDLTDPAILRTGETVLAVIADTLPRCQDAKPASGTSIAERLWPALTAREPTPDAVRVLNAALVLLADHDLAVSTLAVRVAASARADVYAVLSAGLGVVDGRYHGAAVGLAHRFLREALDPTGNATIAVTDRLRTGEPLPGMGHRVYTRHDPRAEALLALLRELAGENIWRNRVVHTVEALAREVAGRDGLFVNVDLALAALVHALDMRADAGEAIFATARTVGWLAHAIEEYREPGLRFRATGVYTGPRPQH